MVTIPEPLIQSLHKDWYTPHVQAIDMLRLDAVHPVVSGNKWYKLKYNLQYAQLNGYISILTFGGAYSNHLVATAAAAQLSGIKAIGIVRGNYATDNLTPTLQQCMNHGMQLHFVSREEYDKKEDKTYLQDLAMQFNNPFIIPEGGNNEWGRKGTEEIASYIPSHYTHICISVGTGTTLAGTRAALPLQQQVLGYVPMKNGIYLKQEIDKHLEPEQRAAYQLFDNWHCGGFGKTNDELLSFMNSFYKINHIPLDIVYTGKMMLGIQQQLQQGYFASGDRILCIHTGGLQGNTSVKDRLVY